MAYQAVFKRYELKYILTLQQKLQLLEIMKPYMQPDLYGRTTIRNIYFDTENYRLIRRSIEKPAYKEKLRLRSYRQADWDDPVFVELKKKYDGVVYKRRILLPQKQAIDWITGMDSYTPKGQISRELEYFRRYYHTLRPSVFLSYEREAFYCPEGSDFRVTFDDTILARKESLSLEESVWGTPLLPPGKVLLELKTGHGIPLWMTDFLTKERIFKTPFSKYGIAYETLIYPHFQGGTFYARSAFPRTF
jgi:hypothetical protein